jgi:hypothetical protein
LHGIGNVAKRLRCASLGRSAYALRLPQFREVVEWRRHPKTGCDALAIIGEGASSRRIDAPRRLSRGARF